MAGSVDRAVGRFGDDGNAALGELVLDADHPILVARNGARGEDDAVAPVELHHRMLALGDARKRRHRFTLAAGDERRDLIARESAEAFLVEIGEMLGPKAGVAGGFHDAVHGAADQHQLAAGCAGSLGDGGEPVHVRGEGGDRDPAFRASDDGLQVLADGFFGGAFAFDQRIGAVADEHAHTFLAQPRELGLVGRVAKAWRVVELPVAGMEHIAARRAQEDHVAFRDRVRNRHQVHVERPDIEAGALRHLDNGHLGCVGVLLELALEQVRRELGYVDGRAQARPHLGHRADVILMRVRDEDAGEAFPFLLDEAQIGQHDIHPRLGIVREGDAAVDHQPLPVLWRADAVEIDVETDFADSAQGQKHKFGTGRRSCL